MTQPNDLPPLPPLPGADGAYNEDNGAWSDTYHVDKMRAYAAAYGLQCAEAAVERERARVLAEIKSHQAGLLQRANSAEAAGKAGEALTFHRDILTLSLAWDNVMHGLL